MIFTANVKTVGKAKLVIHVNINAMPTPAATVGHAMMLETLSDVCVLQDGREALAT